jgi:dienelactone hydrolase
VADHSLKTTLAATALAGALLLAGCSSGAEPSAVRSQDRDVPFTSCDEVECSGDIDGAAFQILMPDTWNGTLLLWSHGIRAPRPLPLSPGEPVNTAAEPAPGWTADAPGEVAQTLLDDGFALAGSAYSSNGWAVDDAVADQSALHDYFVDNVGAPDRTVVWGASLGGLVTAELAERGASWVDGSAPMCGVLGGGVDNLDLALDVTYAIQQLLAPQLDLTGYGSWEAAAAAWQKGYDAIVGAGSDVRRGVPAILMLAALVDAQPQTKTYDGASLESQVRAYGEAAVNALTYGTLFRSDVEARVGGNPSDNLGVDYTARVSDDERALIDSVGGAGSTDRLLRKLARGERVAADPAARAALKDTSTPTGAITDPTLTVHTAADPLVIAQNETLYAERVAANPDRTADLLQAFTVAPPVYGKKAGAPYGAGHCNFTAGTYIGTAELMDRWVRDGVLPAPATIEQALGSDSGYSSAFTPGPWPADLG